MAAQKNESLLTAEEIAATRKRVNEIMEAEGLNANDIAKQSGIAYGTVSAWLKDKYEGRNDRVAADANIWLEAREENARKAATLPDEPDFQMTQSAARFTDTMRYAQMMPDMVLVVGSPGIGKTRTAQHYKATNSNVWLATMQPCTATVHTMLGEIADAMGVDEPVQTKLSRAIGRKLKNPVDPLIIIDEAQHLAVSALDQLRALFDLYGVGIALLGNEKVYSRLAGDSNKTSLAQLYSRVGMRIIQPRPKPGDVCALIAAWGVTDPDAVRYLKSVAGRPGALRTMTKVLRLGSMIAAGAGEPRAKKHFAAAWERLGVDAAAAI